MTIKWSEGVIDSSVLGTYLDSVNDGVRQLTMMMETLYKFTQEASLDMGHVTCDMLGGSGKTVNTGLGLRSGQVWRLS